jgi:ankyrin repeat protein
MMAAVGNHTALANRLVQAGADPNVQADVGVPSLYVSRIYTSFALVIKIGTALTWAAFEDNVDLIKTLLQAGAHVDAQGEVNTTCSDAAAGVVLL